MSALKEILARFGFQVDSKEIDKGEKKADGFAGKLGKMAGNIAQTFAGAAALSGIKGFVDNLIGAGDAITDTAAALGVSRQELQSWNYAGGQVGASAEDMAASFKFLQKNAADGSAAFAKIGVSTKDANGKILGASDLLRDVAQGISGIDDPAQQTKVALELLGKGGTKLLPILKGGSAGVDELRKRFDELGGGLSEEALDALDGAGDAMADLELASMSLKGQLALSLGPAVRQLALWLANGVAWIRKSTADTNIFKAAVIVMGAAVAAAGLAAVAPWLPFIAAITAAVLILDDLMTFFNGGDSLTGRLIDKIAGPGAAAQARETLKSFGRDAFKGFKNGALAGIEEALSVIGARIIGYFAKFFGEEVPEAASMAASNGDFAKVGLTIVESMLGGFGRGLVGVDEKVDELKQAILAKAHSIADEMPGIGKDIVMGLAKGLTDHLDLVEAAAGGVGLHAIKALRGSKGTDSHSPSRPATKTGGDVAMGLALGMQRLAPHVEGAAEMLGAAALPRVATAPSRGSQSISVQQSNTYSTAIHAPAASAKEIAAANVKATRVAANDDRLALWEAVAIG